MNGKTPKILKASLFVFLFLVIFGISLCLLTGICEKYSITDWGKRVINFVSEIDILDKERPEPVKDKLSISHTLKFASSQDLIELVKKQKASLFVNCDGRLFRLKVLGSGKIVFTEEKASSGSLRQLAQKTVPEKVVVEFAKRYSKFLHVDKAKYGLRFSDEIKLRIEQVKENHKNKSGTIEIHGDEKVTFTDGSGN